MFKNKKTWVTTSLVSQCFTYLVADATSCELLINHNSALCEKNEKMKTKNNKAGYTANTSCGRVGRGGNARFHTFRLVFTDRPTDGPTDGRTKALIELRVRN